MIVLLIFSLNIYTWKPSYESTFPFRMPTSMGVFPLRIMQQSKKNVKTMTIVASKIVATLSI